MLKLCRVLSEKYNYFESHNPEQKEKAIQRCQHLQKRCSTCLAGLKLGYIKKSKNLKHTLGCHSQNTKTLAIEEKFQPNPIDCHY